MKRREYRKVVFVVCLLALLTAGVVACVRTRPTAQLRSPNGEIELSVYRVDQDSFRWEYTKGPDWAFSGWNIGGVTDFVLGTFSPDGRHGVLIFADASGTQRYHWTDYENSMSGGIDFEIACKAEETFAQSIREEKGIWTDISFRFLDWHGSENRLLLGYMFTTVDGSEYSGHIWFDLDAYLEKDGILVWEIAD